MELESFFDGTLLKIYAPEGSQIAIGAALCAVGTPGDALHALDAKSVSSPSAAPSPAPAPIPASSTVAPSSASPSSTAASEKTAVLMPSPQSSGRIKASPLARKLAAAKGVDLGQILGSGPGGRIVRADILANASKAPAPAPSDPAPTSSALGQHSTKGPVQEERVVPVSNMRATIARRLLESKTQIPHFYLEVEIDAAPALALRAQLNGVLEKEGVKLSLNDFILKGCAEALRQVPGVNAAWEGTQIRYLSSAHISFAVAIEEGLITPVVRDAHLRTLLQISGEAKSLAKLAKDKKLQPAQFTGGTFCVSNLGMMGIERFSAIINPPNVAILAVGATIEKPVVKNGRLTIGQRLSLSLSCDHRVVDGALGAQFLGALRQILENPALLLL